LLVAGLAFAVMAGSAGAQAPATLTLEEAIRLARQNNPDYLARANDAGAADMAVREAYGSLLPSAAVSGGMRWEDQGQVFLGSLTGSDLGVDRTPAQVYSNYSLGMSYQLSGSTIFNVGRQQATRRATEATVLAAGATLELQVAQAYLTAMRSRDGVELARQELARAEENLRLAQARVDVGAAIGMEATQAEVERGRAEVNLLTAETTHESNKLYLLQVMGVELDGTVQLATTFQVVEPRWTQEELTELAMRNNPQLRATRANVGAASAGVKMAKSSWFPSLSMSAGWSGFARQVLDEQALVDNARNALASQRNACQLANDLYSLLPNPPSPTDCNQFVLTPEAEQLILDRNRQFPFDFQNQPFGVTLNLSLPIFQGFSRQRQIEDAAVAEDDARLRLRSERLRVRTSVATRYLSLTAAYRAVGLEQRNTELADQQLRLARERYEVGSATFLELMEAETLKARADRAYLLAVYAYHEALALLESEVGQPLRTVEGGGR
jgi:outer membrane protein